jgi:hypothetical protein
MDKRHKERRKKQRKHLCLSRPIKMDRAIQGLGKNDRIQAPDWRRGKPHPVIR